VRPAQLPAAIEAARLNPKTAFVLDHVGNPPLRSGDVGAWRDGVAALSELPNVTCKLSGLFTLAEPGADLAAVVEQALSWFGAERCMFGSDWPVCVLATDYGATLALVHDAVPERERELVLSGTAVRTYGLEVT
jgi:L-fuconolactonase